MSDKIKIIEKHSRAIRWFHWIHFPLLMMMIWSGILIYWANRIYIPISDQLSESLRINGRLAEGMGWHFMLMWFFTINGALYAIYLIVSGEWRCIFPNRHSWKQAFFVLLHDLKLTKKNPELTEKFNGAQKIAYTLILINGVFALITGLAIYKPAQLGLLTEALGGYEAARLEHFIVMVIFILFFVVHILQVMKAGWNNFRAMITGYQIIKPASETKKGQD
ncbi:MAG: cytochrome b/b6 domain-containing protein [Bdellovibrio sp.]|nr:cytochrome b/b6 domain-containing protein [Bdellovibrio sp.]